jgi:hypothetical protein
MRLAAIASGALMLAWPALLNRYPIVFSDTHAFLVQIGEPMMIWDKPFFYGPFLGAFHARTTLWLPLAAQALLVSHTLWLARAAFAAPSAGFHLVLCGVLAVGSAAPWFASLLMPDAWGPVAVLCLFLLGFAPELSRLRAVWLVALGGFAIASHLSFLPLAAAVCAVTLLLRGRRRVMAPLALALAMLVATNAVGNGRVGVSPYGAVFAFARLTADGPGLRTLQRDCPGAGWYLCEWTSRMPADSDHILWDSPGPIWSAPGGPKGVAAEAGAVVRRTLWAEPFAVLGNAAENFAAQLFMVRLGDTLGPDWLEGSITGSFNAYFPAAEMARFRAGRQLADDLRRFASPLNPLHAVLLAAGAAATVWLGIGAWRRRDRTMAGLCAVVLVAVLANAAAAGALSKPHHRYQARIAWLVLLPPLLGLRPRVIYAAPVTPRDASPRPPATSGPASRSRSGASR